MHLRKSSCLTVIILGLGVASELHKIHASRLTLLTFSCLSYQNAVVVHQEVGAGEHPRDEGFPGAEVAELHEAEGVEVSAVEQEVVGEDSVEVAVAEVLEAGAVVVEEGFAVHKSVSTDTFFPILISLSSFPTLQLKHYMIQHCVTLYDTYTMVWCLKRALKSTDNDCVIHCPDLDSYAFIDLTSFAMVSDLIPRSCCSVTVCS